ncbi:SHOCT-like domain-containing protein [Deinococcus aerophilus]|uniref:YvlB/LiaX N-terminal domain-containing protein n=1 Tax=Deinococcus aerophilus TaxID=522488 RepID=A0ABQ2GSI5_9DEIO|nr:hypothetical protein [Deinococcus aerophilus]GGM09687.1 hypothetical protein GCM10010841_17650 [Deinococcus aerophilus]
MKEKVKRILELVRAGRLSLEDAGPLLAALSTRLALSASDRELIASLLAREELDTGQVAEHLLLLRGVSAGTVPPSPPLPRRPQVIIGGHRVRGLDDLMDRVTGGLDEVVERISDGFGGSPAASGGPAHAGAPRHSSARILRIQVESAEGDEYSANLPVSLAPHLHKLIPPHGIRALESAGFSLDTLQLLIGADPPPGELINAEDSEGNEVHISLK